MRVDVTEPFGERRDALDQRWFRFLAACDVAASPLPNEPKSALAILETAAGLILSGGNDLAQFGGTVPERDRTEHVLLEAAIRRGLPVVGICRGMQFVANRFAGVLARLPDHAGTPHQVCTTDGRRRFVNSYHEYGVAHPGDSLVVLACAADGSIEAVKHVALPVYGLMWHPEREDEPQPDDVAFFDRLFRQSP